MRIQFSVAVLGMAIASTMPATAEAQAETTGTKKALKQIVGNTTSAPDGTVQPSTGRAKPVENWFGCKPDKGQQDSCDRPSPN